MPAQGWPIYFKDQLIVGDETNSVAICTLWSRKEFFAGKVDRDAFCVIGNLYTADGISYIIRNVLANPCIRHIVLLGADLMKSGDAFVSFMDKGVDSSFKISGTNAFVHGVIGSKNLELFRSSVKLHDMRDGKSVDEVVALVKELGSRKEAAFAEPIVITETEAPSDTLDTKDIAFRIEGRSISEVWIRDVDAILKFGKVKGSDYGIDQKELVDLVSVVEGDEQMPDWLPISAADLNNYITQFFTATKPENVDYTYGERLFAYKMGDVAGKSGEELRNVVNQIDAVEEKLKANKDTRRAIAVTWRHEKDIASDHPPCLVEIVWNIRDNKLYQSATFRSHDVFGAWLLNAYALRELQRKIAKDVGVDAGSMVILSFSGHIYKNGWAAAEELVRRVYTGKDERLDFDKRGYFIIEVDETAKEIVVRHKISDGRDSKYVFRGKRADELYRKVIHENLVSRFDHAAYLGLELGRAEMALKNGTHYQQEAA